ncbi:FkbM family methyltransferase [Bremerella sp. JC770]|uniref:FkbM family methyltransferase n=1 Tax=Bremerella sp. JC770 TaxID=3232137 RepID=UPI003457A478
MNLYDKLHMIVRFWRYRLRTESESIRFLLNQKLKDSVAIDVGANRGIYTYWLSKQVGPSGKVISFEPQPEMISGLEQLRDSFALTNTTFVNKALSSKEDSLTLYRDCVGSGGATLNGQSSDKPSISVDVIRLDDYLAQNSIGSQPISFIKADVEGHELDVFRGAEETLRQHKPILLFECHEADAIKGNVFSFLKDLNYQGFFFRGSQMIDVAEFDKHPYRKPDERHRNYMFLAG